MIIVLIVSALIIWFVINELLYMNKQSNTQKLPAKEEFVKFKLQNVKPIHRTYTSLNYTQDEENVINAVEVINDLNIIEDIIEDVIEINNYQDNSYFDNSSDYNNYINDSSSTDNSNYDNSSTDSSFD